MTLVALVKLPWNLVHSFLDRIIFQTSRLLPFLVSFHETAVAVHWTAPLDVLFYLALSQMPC